MKELLIEELFDKYDFGHTQGLKSTCLEKVKLLKIDNCGQSKDLLYNRGIFLIASGKNMGFINNQHMILENNQYVIISTAQPAECETMMCTEAMKGLYIDLDLKRLQRISQLIEKKSISSLKIPKNVVIGDMNDAIDSAFEKLMQVLLNSEESKVLGENLLDEIYYRIIKTTTGEHLLQLCCQLTHFSRISNIVDEIQNNLEQEVTIDEMAQKAKMHRANFHIKFKEIYDDSPIQYIKKIRLNKAKQFIQFENMKIVDAASKVGYTSPTQFSREFKSHFGYPPSALKEKV